MGGGADADVGFREQGYLLLATPDTQAILAENVVSIPLDPLPNILLWSDNILGPVEDNPVLGPFHTMHLWGLAG